MPDPSRQTTVDTAELRRRAVGNMTDRTGRLIEQAADELDRLRAERDRYKSAWNAVSEKYEDLLGQLGGTDA